MRCRIKDRPGTVLVETALVATLSILIIFGLIVGGIGIYRYHELAYLAEEAARYASVHGTDYGKTFPDKTVPTASDIYEKVIKPKLSAIDPDKLTYSIVWDISNSPLTPSADSLTASRNNVTVSLQYDWLPEIGLLPRLTLSSKATLEMSY